MRRLGFVGLALSLLFSVNAKADGPGVAWSVYIDTYKGGGFFIPQPSKQQCQLALRAMLRRPLTRRERLEQARDPDIRARFATAHGCIVYDARPGPAGVDTSGKYGVDRVCHMPPCCLWAPQVYKDYKGYAVRKIECDQPAD